MTNLTIDKNRKVTLSERPQTNGICYAFDETNIDVSDLRRIQLVLMASGVIRESEDVHFKLKDEFFDTHGEVVFRVYLDIKNRSLIKLGITG